jgi:hypothetical protein
MRSGTRSLKNRRLSVAYLKSLIELLSARGRVPFYPLQVQCVACDKLGSGFDVVILERLLALRDAGVLFWRSQSLSGTTKIVVSDTQWLARKVSQHRV